MRSLIEREGLASVILLVVVAFLIVAFLVWCIREGLRLVEADQRRRAEVFRRIRERGPIRHEKCETCGHWRTGDARSDMVYDRMARDRDVADLQRMQGEGRPRPEGKPPR